MESYDFDRIVPRKNTNCAKWDIAELIFGERDIIPMWVADMDIPVAKPITEALRKRIEHEFYGYPVPLPFSTLVAVINRMKRKFDWDIKPEWVVTTPGVVPAMHNAIRAFTTPGDAVIHQEPVYYHFQGAIESAGCQRAANLLTLKNGRYEIDYEDLAAKFQPKMGMYPSPSRTKMLLLCNPHNPVGRVWTREELIKMGEIAIGNEAVVVSNEIHCEILYQGYRHIPFASISEEFEQNSIVCMAPSKTFNVAGLEASVIIIPNEKLRKQFEQTRKGILPTANVLGLVAMEAAFDKGDVWLEQFLSYLQGNYDYLANYFEKHIPKIKVIKPEGTYLVWLDCRELGLNQAELTDFMNKKARVGLDHGFAFGPSGVGFERINIACPRPLLEEALKRIEKAVTELG
ncbi:MAG: pyridoxal phosphate-dependent aminotransferase [Proteobacteria bacterium]|nr:pyridoxal phosphate-dependent aminotransferase [Pseudomonadota bacterium]